MTEHILDAKITKVYPGPTGKSQHGEWRLWNIYLDKGDGKKFGYMWGGKKPIPQEGMQVKHIEYEIEQNEKDGKTYENYNIKKLELPAGTKPVAIDNTKEDMGPIPKAKNDREVSFYVSYMKDIGTAIIAAGRILEDTDLDAIARKIAKAGIVMMNESLNNTEISPEKPQEGSPVNDQEIEQPIQPEQDNGDYSGRIDCPNLLDNKGNPKNILKRACQTCSQREGCPALG